MDTVEQLRAIARAADDASGYFPAMYAGVTAEVGRRCVDGAFDDAERMEVFVQAFAGYYSRPRADRTQAPLCWQAAWDVSGDERLLVVQHLLLGINAHVNHDLPQVVADLARQGADVPSLRRDFDAVNDVLADAYGSLTKRLGAVARWTGVATRLGGDRLFNFSLRTARTQAWGAAERLMSLDASGRTAYVAELDRLVGVLAYLVTQPRFPVSAVLPLLRRLEERDPHKVTAALLGG